jgi:ectoine hydroxylase-related dioxygenase (phytanoyl-CoA dioxygenase family)
VVHEKAACGRIIAGMTTATETAPATAIRTVTDEERYRFDLDGYLVVRDALAPAQVAELNAILETRIAASVDPEADRHRFYGTDTLLAWGQPYRDLIDHPNILPYLQEFIGDHARLDHDYADVIRRGDGETGSLHGGNAPFDETFFYAHRDGRIRCGLLVVAYSLHDVNPGDGGFGCIPGSHKANYPLPAGWTQLHQPVDCVRAVAAPAGSAIIFTEALTHGTLPWHGQRDRRTVFYKYSPKSISWESNYYDDRDFPGLTDRQRAMLEPPNARHWGRRVGRGHR